MFAADAMRQRRHERDDHAFAVDRYDFVAGFQSRTGKKASRFDRPDDQSS